MTEVIINDIQLVTAGACAAYALMRALLSRRRAWILLTLFFGAFFLGDLYWQLFLLFYGSNPHYSEAPGLNWFSAYLFLLLLVMHLREGAPKRRPGLLLWLIPVFTSAMCVYYMTWGDYLDNLICAVLMPLLMWNSTRGLADPRFTGDGIGSIRDEAACSPGSRCASGTGKGKTLFYAATLLFCLTEYGMWTCSCIWTGDTMRNPYYWFDLLLCLLMPLFTAALAKEAEV